MRESRKDILFVVFAVAIVGLLVTVGVVAAHEQGYQSQYSYGGRCVHTRPRNVHVPADYASIKREVLAVAPQAEPYPRAAFRPNAASRYYQHDFDATGMAAHFEHNLRDLSPNAGSTLLWHVRYRGVQAKLWLDWACDAQEVYVRLRCDESGRDGGMWLSFSNVQVTFDDDDGQLSVSLDTRASWTSEYGYSSSSSSGGHVTDVDLRKPVSSAQPDPATKARTSDF